MTTTIYTFTNPQIKELHDLYQQEWWTKERSLEDTKKCVENSQICIGITDENNHLIGFVRVITDYVFKAFIFDLIIHPDHRNQGLGKRLMNEVLHHKKLSGVKHFELYCLPEMKNWYEPFGFNCHSGGVQLLRRNKSALLLNI